MFALWPLAIAREISPAGLFRALVAPPRALAAPALSPGLLALALARPCGARHRGRAAADGSAPGSCSTVAVAAALLWGLAPAGPARRPRGSPTAAASRCAWRSPTCTGRARRRRERDHGAGRRRRRADDGRGLLDRQPAQRGRPAPADRARRRSILSTCSRSSATGSGSRWRDDARRHAPAAARCPSLRARVVRIAGQPVAEVNVADQCRLDRAPRTAASPTQRPCPQGTELVAGQLVARRLPGPAPGLDRRGDRQGLRRRGRRHADLQRARPQIEARIANIRARGRLESAAGSTSCSSSARACSRRRPHTFVAAVDVPPPTRRGCSTGSPPRCRTSPRSRSASWSPRSTEVLGRIELAVDIVAGLTLGGGILALAGGIAAARRRQRYETVVLKVLGARRLDADAGFPDRISGAGRDRGARRRAARPRRRRLVVTRRWACPGFRRRRAAVLLVGSRCPWRGRSAAWRLLGQPAAPCCARLTAASRSCASAWRPSFRRAAARRQRGYGSRHARDRSLSFLATAFVAGRDLVPVALRAAAGAGLRLLRRRQLAGGAARPAGAARCRRWPWPSCLRARLLDGVRGASAPAPPRSGSCCSAGATSWASSPASSCSCSACTCWASADPAAGARGALPCRVGGGRVRRRVPARARLRLRLDALHRPGARRDPDA